MELRQVKYFVAVAEELHFGKAAKKVGIAQPALSQQIQQLEQELGGMLFIRTKRSVSLTAAGNLFLKEARLLLTQSERAMELVKRAFSGFVGDLVLGFVESATWDILPHVISAYRDQYPDIRITLRHLHTIDQINAIREGNVHVGIVGLPVNDPDLCVYVIKKEPYWVALPPVHRLAVSDSKIFVSNLSQEPFIATNREVGATYYDTMVKVCIDAGFSPSIVQTVNEMQTMLSLVSSGIGIALIHESAKNLRNDIVYKPLHGTNQYAYQMSLVWRKGDTSPIIKGFLEVIRHLFTVSL
jgi:DNA-binding transcriptional LysR family regulator